MVIEGLRRARDAVARQLAEADPDRVRAVQAAELVTLFAEIERLGSAGKVLFSARAADSTVWRDEGHRSAASWMAETTKTAYGEAQATLETATALAALPETTEALRRGELSRPQVQLIAQAAHDRPRAERELLEAAASHSLKGLRERCLKVRAAASSEAEELERYNAIRRSRSLRHWSDPDGSFRLDARLTPDAGAQLLGALQAEADARFAAARAAESHEPPCAYLADALVALVTSMGAHKRQGGASTGATKTKSTGPRSTLIVRVDGSALRRGHVTSGEVCEIPGIGPVPVAHVLRQLPEAFVKVVIRDGVDITTVCHLGRGIPAHLQSALEERDPTCVVPGCDVAQGLEAHHWQVSFAKCGTSTLASLARLCHWHHDLITYDGYALSGGPGKWEMRAPPDARFDTG